MNHSTHDNSIEDKSNESVLSESNDKKNEKKHKKKFNWFWVVVMILITTFIVVTVVKQKNCKKDEFKSNNQEVEEFENESINETNQSGYDLYDEIKEFMDKQTSYVMKTQN